MRNKNYLYFKDTSKNIPDRKCWYMSKPGIFLFHSNQEQFIWSVIALLSALPEKLCCFFSYPFSRYNHLQLCVYFPISFYCFSFILDSYVGKMAGFKYSIEDHCKFLFYVSSQIRKAKKSISEYKVKVNLQVH